MAEHLVDGGLPLAAQQDTLNFIEEASFGKVVAYDASSDACSRMNQAVIQDVPIGQQLAALHLIALGADEDAAAVIASQVTSGRTLAFKGSAYVAGAETQLLAFR